MCGPPHSCPVSYTPPLLSATPFLPLSQPAHLLKTTMTLPDQSNWILEPHLPVCAISLSITCPSAHLSFRWDFLWNSAGHSGFTLVEGWWDGLGGQRLEAEHRCTGRGEWGGLDIGQSHMEKICLLPSSPVLYRGGRLSHDQISLDLGLLLKPACCLSSINENIISKKRHCPWRHRVIMGDIYLSKCEVQPW